MDDTDGDARSRCAACEAEMPPDRSVCPACGVFQLASSRQPPLGATGSGQRGVGPLGSVPGPIWSAVSPTPPAPRRAGRMLAVVAGLLVACAVMGIAFALATAG